MRGARNLQRRLHDEPAPRDRTEFERDRDRLLYSSAFARLSGITQVMSGTPGQGFHNRLTHTLKVGQLSSRLSKKLKALYPDIDAVQELEPEASEAAAFAHDLGHPPFGHLGEATLASLAQDTCGGFEANAQSFRIVNRLACRSWLFEGLNLTRLTLDGMLKYPWLRGEAQGSDAGEIARTKWGAYDDDGAAFRFARGLGSHDQPPRTSAGVVPSLTAQIIDWADDVTYAVHDLEDFYKAGLIPTHELVWSPTELEAFMASLYVDGVVRPKFGALTSDQLQSAGEALKRLLSTSISRPYDDSVEVRALVRLVCSNLIGEYVGAVEVTQQDGVIRLHMDEALEAEVALLKELLWFYVIDRPDFARAQLGQARRLRRLFSWLLEISANQNELRLFPAAVRDALRTACDAADPNAARARVIVDHVASMTEAQVTELDRDLGGQ